MRSRIASPYMHAGIGALSGRSRKFLWSVEATDSGDDLLWRYVVSGADEADHSRYTLIRQLRCGLNSSPIPEFLRDRMLRSDVLLNLAITAVEQWSVARIRSNQQPRRWDNALLSIASVRLTNKGPAAVLIGAIEAACLERAASGCQWWRDMPIGFARKTRSQFRVFNGTLGVHRLLQSYKHGARSLRSRAGLNDADGLPFTAHSPALFLRASYRPDKTRVCTLTSAPRQCVAPIFDWTDSAVLYL
jgi:hypothetical protein